MVHSKNEHMETVNVCWEYSAGKCDPGDELCLFMHCDELQKADFSGVNCNICWKTFQNINLFFHHKKSEHKGCLTNKRHTFIFEILFMDTVCIIKRIVGFESW